MRSHVLRARPRSQLWTPAAISTALWLDASDSSTITTSSGAVSEWRDKSGNSRHFTQGTSGNRPALTAAGLNSLDVITFDGSDDRLVSNAAASTWAFLHNTTGASVYIVFRHTHNNTLGVLLDTTALSTANLGMGLWVDDRSSLSREDKLVCLVGPLGGGSIRVINCSTVDDWVAASTDYMLSVLIDPGNATAANRFLARKGGASLQSPNTENNAASSSNPTYTLTIGSSAASATTGPLSGYIAEIVIRSGVDGATNRQLIEGYLAHKWGLSSDLDAGHPYKSAAPTT